MSTDDEAYHVMLGWRQPVAALFPVSEDWAWSDEWYPQNFQGLFPLADAIEMELLNNEKHLEYGTQSSLRDSLAK